MTDTGNANDQVLLTNTPAQAKFLLHSLEQAVVDIGLYTKQSSCVLNKEPSPI